MRRSIGGVCLKTALFLIAVAILAQLMAGSTVSINYNNDRARQVKSKAWQGTLRIATKIGELRRAVNK